MDIINIEEIHASDRLKKEKYEEAKSAIMDKVFKGVMLKEKS